MTETRDQRVHAIVYSTDSREELGERIVALEDENERLRELCVDLLQCISSDYDCYGCRYDKWDDCRDGCTLIARAKDLGIEEEHE